MKGTPSLMLGDESRSAEVTGISKVGATPTTVAGRYVIESELARGGMGVVYRVVDSSSGSSLALKRSLQTKGCAEALEREYRTLVSLRHPRIVQVYDFGIDAQGAFYTMELLDGDDLRARSPLHWREVCAHIRQIASSLALLHSRRLLHRDVSAANIRLTGEGRAKLIDFGTLTTFGRCTTVAGTPSGVAPEALEGADLDARVDLYALGATAYYALTGRHAYPARSLADLPFVWRCGVPTPPSKLVTGIPSELDEVVLSLLSLDRTARPSSAAEVIDRVAAIAGLEPEADDQVVQSYLVGQELVGRNAPFERLLSAFHKAKSGQGSTVFVEARTGYGRTALLQRLEREARIAGAAVLAVSARAHQRPFGTCSALAQRALSELPESAAGLAKQHLTRVDALLRDSRSTRASVRPREGEVPTQTLGDDQTGDAFEQFFRGLAAAGLVVVIVDDLHAADGQSLPVLAALAKTTLAKTAPQQSLLMVAAVNSEDPGGRRVAIELLRRSARRVRLRRLSAVEVERLVNNMFGEVPATKRLAAWLHEQTHGSPLLCNELIGYLVKQGRIQYVEGTWVLPHEFPDGDVHAVLATAMRSQLERLRPELRRFAECLSPHRRSLDRDLCDVLRRADPQLAAMELDKLLTALVHEGLLIGGGGEYTFARPHIRELLYAGIDDTRRRALHRCAAVELSAHAKGDPERALEVGWHLLLSGDRPGAADHIASSLQEIGASPDLLVRAVPPLKELRQQYLQSEPTADELLPVTGSLVIAGYYVDPSVHDEVGDNVAELLYRKTGFALAARLVPWFGSYVALFVGLLWGMLQFWRSRRWHRGQHFESMMRFFVGVCAARSGVAYLRLEPNVHEFVLRLLSPAKGLHPHNALRLVHDLIALTMAESRGELGKRQEGYQDQLARLPHVNILEEARHHYEAALLCSQGQLLLFRTGTGALECADRVDALGSQHDRIVAQFLRFSHYLFRGESNKAQAAQETLDAIAAKYGHRWVPDVLAVLDLVPYHLSADVVGLKRVLHRTQRLLAIAPNLTVYRDVVRAMYEGHRGRPDVALTVYERLDAQLRPFTHPVWSFAHGHRAECLNDLGRHEEALAVCREALQQVGALSRVYVVAYQQLEREAAMALAHLGRTEEAKQQLDELLALHEQDSHPLLIGLLHRDRARVGRLANEDRAAFERHTARACAEFLSTENPVLLRQANRLAQLARSVQQAQTSAVAPEPEFSLLSTLTSASPDLLAQHALQHLVMLSGASHAYLYLVQNGRGMLCARHGNKEAPDISIETDVEGLVATYSEEFATERTAIEGPASSDGRPHHLVPLLVRKDGRCELVGVAAVSAYERLDLLTSEQLERVAAVLRGGR